MIGLLKLYTLSEPWSGIGQKWNMSNMAKHKNELNIFEDVDKAHSSIAKFWLMPDT